jgi:sugar lactone lactonase YvrE
MNMNALRSLLVAIAALALLAPAGLAHKSGSGKKHSHKNLPQRIALPNGFQPEGIASTGGSTLYAGSIPTGAVWKGSAKSGKGAVLVPPHEGRSAIGIKVAKGLIFVAGGATGDAYVYNAKTGGDVASYQLAPEGANTFVNDLVVTSRAVYLTDSRLQQLYVLPLGKDGKLPTQADVKTLPLTGDIAYTTGNNANGIAATPNGKSLIVVQGNVGKLFKVDPKTGVAREIDLGGANVQNGDGLLLEGRTLYVVRNQANRVAVIKLRKDLLEGDVKKLIADDGFAVPTTITRAAGKLWVVNARFGTPPGPDVQYWIARVG